MAGAGYKLFNTGDVLTAAQVNTYLMEQTVMVFADAAARTTALSGVVSEGMISYLKDTNAVEVYDGSAWVASDDPNAIQNTIVDAKGDLIAASANDTPARLAVGSDGSQLVADSSASTGLRWNGSAIGRNQVYNSQFNIWQRGTSINTISTINYTADRWSAWTFSAGGSVTTSRQTTSDTTNLPNIQYCARFQRTAGNTNTGLVVLGQVFETNESIKYAGKTVTLSFYARKGANFSDTRIAAQVWTNTTTDASLNTVQSGSATPIAYDAPVTTTWQRFSASGTLSSSMTQMAIALFFAPTGTAGANDYFEVTGVQLELGSVATPYSPMSDTLAGELAACQRYFTKSYNQVDAPGTATAGGAVAVRVNGTGVNNVTVPVQYKVTMRTAPTVTIYSGTGVTSQFSNDYAGTTSFNNVNVNNDGMSGFNAENSTTATSLMMFHYTASAEL